MLSFAVKQMQDSLSCSLSHAVMTRHHTDITSVHDHPSPNLPHLVISMQTIDHGCPSVPLQPHPVPFMHCPTAEPSLSSNFTTILSITSAVTAAQRQAHRAQHPSIAALNSTPRSSALPTILFAAYVAALALRAITRGQAGRPRDVSARGTCVQLFAFLSVCTCALVHLSHFLTNQTDLLLHF
jgi:hypothetical protein